MLGLVPFSAVFSFSQSEIDIDDIEKGLACQCECAMTVESCQGAMACSSAEAISEEIKVLVAQGNDKDATLKALVAKYGEKILSAPTKKGFNLAVWILPFFVLLIGAYLVQLFVRRWVGANQKTDLVEENYNEKLDARYRSVLEKELKEFEE